jgi:uncharacterized protein (DUF433 family)
MSVASSLFILGRNDKLASSDKWIDTMDRVLIISDPAIMMGKPLVSGTRITVEYILEKLAAGEPVEQILDAHPQLTREAVLAAINFAREALRADVVYPVPRQAA